MASRFNLGKVHPAAYTAMEGLEKFIAASSVEPNYRHLIKLRASILNGCGYCVDMHAFDAKKTGETEQRLYLVAAWKEAGNNFTEEERLMFQMTDEITLIHQHGLSDD